MNKGKSTHFDVAVTTKKLRLDLFYLLRWHFACSWLPHLREGETIGRTNVSFFYRFFHQGDFTTGH